MNFITYNLQLTQPISGKAKGDAQICLILRFVVFSPLRISRKVRHEPPRMTWIFLGFQDRVELRPDSDLPEDRD